MQLELDVLKHQREFIESRELHTALCGGYGSGKSEGGVYKAIIKKLEYPNVNVAYYLPTYPLIEDVAFPKFESALMHQIDQSKLLEGEKALVLAILALTNEIRKLRSTWRQ